MDSEMRGSVKSALSSIECICHQSTATVYYDAWANDNAEDPILSLVYTAIKNNQIDVKPENKKNLVEIVATIADVVTGRNVSTLHEKKPVALISLSL